MGGSLFLGNRPARIARKSTRREWDSLGENLQNPAEGKKALEGGTGGDKGPP